MFGNNSESTDRGQVGIGTLIVFIAMVLVAAIAAGVLINTAGFLQAQAEATGEESAEQVSDRVQVVSVVGNANDSEEIDELEISVRRSPGAGNIDLNNSIVEVFANGNSSTLTFSADDSPNADNFNITMIEGDDNVLADSGDRADLIVDLSENGQALEEGDSVTVTITTASGGTAFVEKRAPSTVESDESYRL
ncbi:flagellin [Halorubraceae archaeon YAN]|nr:flagellin [Halorubraceae archaeon YAN]